MVRKLAIDGDCRIIPDTWNLIKEFVRAEDKGPIMVKGKSEEIRVYHVLSIDSPKRDADYVQRASPRV